MRYVDRFVQAIPVFYLVWALPLLLALSVLIPPAQQPDEPAHFLRTGADCRRQPVRAPRRRQRRRSGGYRCHAGIGSLLPGVLSPRGEDHQCDACRVQFHPLERQDAGSRISQRCDFSAVDVRARRLGGVGRPDVGSDRRPDAFSCPRDQCACRGLGDIPGARRGQTHPLRACRAGGYAHDACARRLGQPRRSDDRVGLSGGRNDRSGDRREPRRDPPRNRADSGRARPAGDGAAALRRACGPAAADRAHSVVAAVGRRGSGRRGNLRLVDLHGDVQPDAVGSGRPVRAMGAGESRSNLARSRALANVGPGMDGVGRAARRQARVARHTPAHLLYPDGRRCADPDIFERDGGSCAPALAAGRSRFSSAS